MVWGIEQQWRKNNDRMPLVFINELFPSLFLALMYLNCNIKYKENHCFNNWIKPSINRLYSKRSIEKSNVDLDLVEEYVEVLLRTVCFFIYFLNDINESLNIKLDARVRTSCIINVNFVCLWMMDWLVIIEVIFTLI